MIAKFKSFFKNLASRWCHEEHLIKTCNRATPLHRRVSNAISCVFIVIFIIVWLFSFRSSASEDLSPLSSTPTDLTGYTVTVPDGWSCPALWSEYSIKGVLSLYPDYEMDGFTLGFNPFIDAIIADTIYFWGDFGTHLFNPRNTFSFNVTGGNDVANPSLIQWLVDNNATFSKNSGGGGSNLTTFNAGLYKVTSDWYNSPITTQLDGMTFYTLSEGDLFTALTVQNDELIFDDENGDMHVMARNTTTGAKWIDNSGQFVYFINDESIPQSLADQIPTLLEYIPDVSLTEYQRMQDSWYYGVQDGFTEGYNQASRDTEGTFLGNIFGGVFDALDKFQMFGQFSFLDFIKSIVGILALIWFLKLLAGG